MKREFKGQDHIAFPDSFTIVDIETTGLDPSYDEIIEVAAMRIRNGKIVDEFVSLVKPDSHLVGENSEENHPFVNGERIQYIRPFIEGLTGIKNEMIEDAPSVMEVLPDYLNFLGDDVLVGHNINFDINFLYDNMMRHLEARLMNDFIDTMRLSRHLLKELNHHRLKDMVAHFHIKDSVSHRALDDCNSTLQCYLRLKDLAEERYEKLEVFISESSKNRPHPLSAAEITTVNDVFDSSHPLFGRLCVFTGTLEKMPRKDAMQIVVNLGGMNGEGVTTKTNILILGNNDYCPANRDGKSTKQKRAEQLILNGQDLIIISENVFYDLAGI